MIVDERSDAEVYAAHADELVRFATGLVGRSDAEDVVSEAVLSVMSSRVWPHARNRRALLYRAVLFQARSWLRSTARRRRREASIANKGSGEMPEAVPEVWDAVRVLSPQQRAVVFLTYWDDQGVDAVAELLGVSAGTVRRQLGRARRRLREVLNEQES